MNIREFYARRNLGSKEYTLAASVLMAGEDLCVVVTGGEMPHIGSVSISQPRPSMEVLSFVSATTSTFNFMGHKDDEIGNVFAASLASTLNRKAVVLCGIHIDQISQEELSMIRDMGKSLLADILAELTLPVQPNVNTHA